MEGKGDVARFMPTICHYAGIPLPGTGDDSIQTRAQSSKNMQVNEVIFKLQTFITVLHAKCNTGEKDFKSEQCKHERSQRAKEDK